MIVEAPPLPQQRVAVTEFVPYATDAYAQAHAQAREQLVRKYPRSVEYLEAEQSLIHQILNAQKQ